MLKGRDEGIEDTAPKAKEKAKRLGSWWMASTPLPSLGNQGISPTLQPLWFSDPRTESYHGLGVRSSSSRGSKSKRSEFTTSCVIFLVCFLYSDVQFWNNQKIALSKSERVEDYSIREFVVRRNDGIEKDAQHHSNSKCHIEKALVSASENNFDVLVWWFLVTTWCNVVVCFAFSNAALLLLRSQSRVQLKIKTNKNVLAKLGPGVTGQTYNDAW